MTSRECIRAAVAIPITSFIKA